VSVHAAYTTCVSQVKGSAFTSRVLWLEINHGAAGLDRVIHQASPELRATLGGRLSKAQWYPFDQFVEINTVIDRLFGHGDLELVRTLGRFGADANLTTIYRLFFKVGTVHWILGRAVRLWSAHYDSGFMEVATRGPKGAVLRIRGFETPHRAHCLSVHGWAERSIELSGGDRPVMREVKCRCRDDEYCQFDVNWG